MRIAAFRARLICFTGIAFKKSTTWRAVTNFICVCSMRERIFQLSVARLYAFEFILNELVICHFIWVLIAAHFIRRIAPVLDLHVEVCLARIC